MNVGVELLGQLKKLTDISNTELGTVDLRTRKETESRAECLEFVESFNKTLNNPK